MIRKCRSKVRSGPLADLTLGLSLVFLFHGASPSSHAANDWPQWRGPDRTGVSLETGLLQEWPEGGPNLLWEIGGLGQGDGSPITVGAFLFIQGTRGKDSMLFCRNRETGDSVWEVRLDRSFDNANNPGPSSTPVVDGNRIYALSGYGVLICANMDDGSLLWQINLATDLNGSALGLFGNTPDRRRKVNRRSGRSRWYGGCT